MSKITDQLDANLALLRYKYVCDSHANANIPILKNRKYSDVEIALLQSLFVNTIVPLLIAVQSPKLKLSDVNTGRGAPSLHIVGFENKNKGNEFSFLCSWSVHKPTIDEDIATYGYPIIQSIVDALKAELTPDWNLIVAGTCCEIAYIMLQYNGENSSIYFSKKEYDELSHVFMEQCFEQFRREDQY